MMTIKEYYEYLIKKEQDKINKVKENEKSCIICKGTRKIKNEGVSKFSFSMACDCQKTGDNTFIYDTQIKLKELKELELIMLTDIKHDRLTKNVSLEKIKPFIENKKVKYKNMWLYGKSGVGKTTLVKQLNYFSLLKRGSLLKYHKEIELKSEYGEIGVKYTNIIDDLGYKLKKGKYNNYLFWFCMVLDLAFERGTTLWITSNYSPEEYIEEISKIDSMTSIRVKNRLKDFYVKEIKESDFIK